MSCHQCCSEFRVFNKEIGCQSCGFLFCSKCCIRRMIADEAGKSVKKHLCKKCYEVVTGAKPSSKVDNISPPLVHQKRMAAFNKHSMSVDSSFNVSASQIGGQNEKDRILAERLQKLKREMGKGLIPSEDEIRERLARLKGVDPTHYTAPPIEVFRPPKIQTVEEAVSAVMKQIKEEVDLESNLKKPEDEIAQRLANLRGQPMPPKPASEVEPTFSVAIEHDLSEVDIDSVLSDMQQQYNKTSKSASLELKDLLKEDDIKAFLKSKTSDTKENTESDVDDDSESESEKLLNQLLAVNIEGLESLNSSEKQTLEKKDKICEIEDEDDSTKEFPWCVICAEDAQMRCFDCDSDLYCKRCFKECHDSLGIKDHKSCPFLFPRKQ